MFHFLSNTGCPFNTRTLAI